MNNCQRTTAKDPQENQLTVQTSDAIPSKPDTQLPKTPNKDKNTNQDNRVRGPIVPWETGDKDSYFESAQTSGHE